MLSPSSSLPTLESRVRTRRHAHSYPLTELPKEEDPEKLHAPEEEEEIKERLRRQGDIK